MQKKIHHVMRGSFFGMQMIGMQMNGISMHNVLALGQLQASLQSCNMG